MKVIISGSRSLRLSPHGEAYLDEFFKTVKVDLVLNGDCSTGIDADVRNYCRRRGIPFKLYPALWDDLEVESVYIKYNTWGKRFNARAGHNRNEAMAFAAKPDGICIVFVGNNGTDNMFDVATKAGLTVFDLRRRDDLVIDLTEECITS